MRPMEEIKIAMDNAFGESDSTKLMFLCGEVLLDVREILEDITQSNTSPIKVKVAEEG